jgi:hypothetical protein
MTNLEKIRAMSAEELTELVVRLHNACYFCSGRRDCHAIGKVLRRDCAIKKCLEAEVEE